MCRASGPHLPRAGKITTKGTKEQGEAEFFSRLEGQASACPRLRDKTRICHGLCRPTEKEFLAKDAKFFYARGNSPRRSPRPRTKM